MSGGPTRWAVPKESIRPAAPRDSAGRLLHPQRAPGRAGTTRQEALPRSRNDAVECDARS